MKEIRNKKGIKQIIIIIVMIMLCNFIMPNYSYAVSTEGGGSLLKVISQFVCAIPDIVLNYLQEIFVSPQNIYNEETQQYEFLYSPGTIFAGQVPAFNINFIEPMEEKIEEVVKKDYIDLVTNATGIDYIIEQSANTVLVQTGYKEDISNQEDNSDKQIIDNAFNDEDLQYYTSGDTLKLGPLSDGITYELYTMSERYLVVGDKDAELNEYGGKPFLHTLDYQHKSFSEVKEEMREWCYANIIPSTTTETEKSEYDTKKEEYSNLLREKFNSIVEEEKSLDNPPVIIREFSFEGLNLSLRYSETTNDFTLMLEKIVERNTVVYKSSAGILQNIVATWYNALRRIALVGLLSVLVYIGIRIVLTSTSAKDKAKYKSMLKDWLIALCILFAMHYIMSITIAVVDKINEVIKASSIGANGEDILMSTVRNYIAKGDEGWGDVLAYVVIYCVLAVYTVIYSIQYLRRVIYIAFLTMIAPLITLTYPLDKMKDKKAQAFDMWLKDYLFFSLIQVLHLLIYYIFLGSSLDLANQGNWLFAIVAIGFMTKAEKLMKKMFGFEKSKTLSALGAGATGALVMNAINKISHKPSKGGGSGGGQSASGEGTSSNVRTATTNPLVSLSTGGAMPVSNSGGNTSSGSQESVSSSGMSSSGGNSSESTRYRNGRNK